MFRRNFPSGGLLFQPAGSFHTAFVRFPLDALFLDSKGTILRICSAVPPWQIRWAPKRAAFLLEFPDGTIARWNVQEGDVLRLEPSPADR